MSLRGRCSKRRRVTRGGKVWAHLQQMSCEAKLIEDTEWYGVATISRLLKILGLFCRISSLLQGSFAKKTYNFKAPTHRSHPIEADVRFSV